MADAPLSTDQNTIVVTEFNDIPDLVFGDIEMEVMPTVAGRRRWIEIADGADSVMLSVDEARAVRDWLNRVLPGNSQPPRKAYSNPQGGPEYDAP